MKPALIILGVVLLAPAAFAAGKNLIENPGFETERTTGDWANVWGWFSREASCNPPEGKMAGFLRGGKDPNIGIIQQVRHLTPGTIYRLSARFRTEDGVAARTYRF